MFKIGAITLGKLKGVGYKLGLVKLKIENLESVKMPAINLPEEYREWYPGKEKEIEKAEQLKSGYESKSATYVKKNQMIL